MVGGPSGASYENSTVRFGDEDFVTFEFRAHPDPDYDDEAIRTTIDADNLPDDFYLGENHDWELTIIDNRAPSAFFFVENATLDQLDHLGGLNLTPRIGDVIDVQVRVRPPGIRIKIGANED